MITLVKFIINKIEKAPPNNKVITKTLGKTGVISWEHVMYPEQIPKAEEFWFVKIVAEKGHGTPRGVFLLEPIERVEVCPDTNKPEITHMIPGTYTIERINNVLLLHPKILTYPEELGPNWICSLTTKRKLMTKYKEGDDYKINSIIVVFDRQSEWPKEDKLEDNSADIPAERSATVMVPT